MDFCSTILRISTAFGISSRMRFDLTISEFTKEMAISKDLLVYDENTWRPYCHVSDISRAIIKVLNADKNVVNGEVFNVGGDEGNFTKKMVVDLLQTKIQDSQVTFKTGGFDPRNYRVSFDKIKNQLDFSVEYNVDGAINNLLRAFDNNAFDDLNLRKNFYGNYFINE